MICNQKTIRAHKPLPMLNNFHLSSIYTERHTDWCVTSSFYSTSVKFHSKTSKGSKSGTKCHIQITTQIKLINLVCTNVTKFHGNQATLCWWTRLELWLEWLFYCTFPCRRPFWVQWIAPLVPVLTKDSPLLCISCLAVIFLPVPLLTCLCPVRWFCNRPFPWLTFWHSTEGKAHV